MKRAAPRGPIAWVEACWRDHHRVGLWLVGLYAATLALRLIEWRNVVDGDEAWHFFASEHLGREPDTLYVMGPEGPQHLGRLVWWRPLFVLLLSPFAQFGFDAWRLGNILLTATIPMLGLLCVRAAGGARWAQAGTGVALLIQPALERWTTVGFADGLMTAFFFAGLWRWLRGQPVQAVLLFVAACWTKETALVGAAYMGAWGLVRSLRGRANGEPWQETRRWFVPVLAAPVGAIPLVVYLLRGGATPGWASGAHADQALNLLFLPWLALPLLIGLAFKRTRRVAGLPLVIVAFHFFYTSVGHHALEAWYAVLPGSLALVATGLVAHRAIQRAGTRNAGRLTRGLAIGLALLVAAQAVVPASTSGKDAWMGARGRFGPQSLLDVVHEQAQRDRDFQAVIDAVEGQGWGHVFLIDTPWFVPYYPFADKATRITWGETAMAPNDSRDEWNATVAASDVTVFDIVLPHGPLFDGLRSTWAGCVALTNARFTVVVPGECRKRPGDTAPPSRFYRVGCVGGSVVPAASQNKTSPVAPSRPQPWLVTGGAGFLGQSLVRRLLGLGQKVRVLDTAPPTQMPTDLHVEYVQADVRDAAKNSSRFRVRPFDSARVTTAPAGEEMGRE